MADFTPVPALLGGILIGGSASLLWLGNGRVAGVSGVLGGLMPPVAGDAGWRAAFVGGLLAGGALLAVAAPAALGPAVVPPAQVAVAGLLVGVGTRLGNGCTSGHGVCGLSRGSGRSLAATLTFMAAGFATVFVAHRLGGGA